MAEKKIRSATRRLSETYTESSRYQLYTPSTEEGKEGKVELYEPKVASEVKNASRWRRQTVPKEVVESMLSRMEEWTQAKWERIDAELKVPCTGKCSYNGCSTCSLQPLSKHTKVVYVPDVNGPKCLLGCIPKYETLEPLETQKEVNGTLIHLAKRNEVKTHKKRKDTFEKYCPNMSQKDKELLGLMDEPPPLPSIDECGEDMQKYVDARQQAKDSQKEKTKELYAQMSLATKGVREAQEKRLEDRQAVILAKQDEVAAFDAVRADRQVALKAQMKASLRSMYDASRAYFERLVAMQEKSHSAMLERQQVWKEVAVQREAALRELEVKRIEVLREFREAERARLNADAERVAGYSETQWAKELRDFGINDRERAAKAEEVREESMQKQKVMAREAANEYKAKLAELLSRKDAEMQERMEEVREKAKKYEEEQKARAERAREAMKAEREAVKQRAIESERKFEERLALHKGAFGQ